MSSNSQTESIVTQFEIKLAFPNVSCSESKFINVKGEKSPFDGDINYWTKRNSVLYDGATAKTLKKQSHSCGHCGLKFLTEEKVELHHIDGNHNNWNNDNLLAVHRSCHQYTHMKQKKLDEAKASRPDSKEMGDI